MPERTTELLRSRIDEGLADVAALADIDPADRLVIVVRDARLEGLSWEAVARRVFIMSGVSISGQTLRVWFPQYNKPLAELTRELATKSP